MILLPLVAWAAATGAHLALTALAAHRALAPDEASLDERVFVSVLGGIASLSIVMHTAAATIGLGLASGLGGLALWQAGLWAIVARGTPARARPAAGGGVTALETLALTVLAGIVLTWCAGALASDGVAGPDAAHYHVPAAVNLAQGAGVFGLPATPHLYPLAGSVVSAWFIVPTGDPLLVDMANILPFALLVASLNLLFRCTTGLSGTAWASWCSLALFSTPMFRNASEGSADLWMAAAFASVLAVIFLAWFRGRWNGLRVVLAGGAFGLLVGSKTTGVLAAGLLVAAAVALAAGRRVFGGPHVGWPRRPGAAAAAAAIACVGAGGLWLVRNWVQFGSPVAPAGLTIGGVEILQGGSFQRGTYLSVLAEMNDPAFDLWSRARHFIGLWMGPWFLAALLPAAAMVPDLIVRAGDRGSDARWWWRLSLLLMSVGASAALAWFLTGAPWTGLEWSGGLSLRYLLPVAAVLPLVSFAACFPLSVAWHQRRQLRAAAAAVIVMGAMALFWRALQPAAPGGIDFGVPNLRWPWLGAAAAAAVAGRWMRGRSRAHGRVALAVALAGLLTWWAPAASSQAVRVRAQRQLALEAEALAFVAGPRQAAAWREPFLAVRAAEHAEGRRCERQRFFALTRFDEPLALQSPRFTNQVFYAGRDVEAARGAGPIADCDYIITTPAVEDTDKGRALAAALAGQGRLRSFARTGRFVILAPASR